MRELLRHFVILSAERSTQATARNVADTQALRALLRVAPSPFREVRGVFEGQSEVSFAVFLSAGETRRQDQLEALLRLAGAFHQDSILYVDGDRHVELITANYRGSQVRQALGKWIETLDAEEVQGRDHTSYKDQDGTVHYAYTREV